MAETNVRTYSIIAAAVEVWGYISFHTNNSSMSLSCVRALASVNCKSLIKNDLLHVAKKDHSSFKPDNDTNPP